MKIRIPLVKQKGRNNCGSASLKMVFSYFKNPISLKDLEKEIGYKEGKGTSPIKLAIATKKLGCKVLFFSKNFIPSKENLEMDFFKKYMDEEIGTIKSLINEAKKLDIPLIEKSISLKELLSFISKKSIPIVLLDWNTVRNREKAGFMGHYVPLVGYNNKSVYINNSAGRNGRRLQPINKNIFDKARKARGTDEDILIIYKNKCFEKPKHL